MRITGGRSESLFTPEEMEEYIKRGAARRKNVQQYALELQRAKDAAEMARRERAEVGQTRRQGMIEAGELEQQRRLHTFAGPREMALTRKTEGEATVTDLMNLDIRKDMGMVPSLRTTPSGIPLATNAPIGPEPEVATPTANVNLGTAKPAQRKLRPSVRRFLWEGTPTKTGLNLPGLLAPIYGYKNINDWLKHLGSKAYDYAFPRR